MDTVLDFLYLRRLKFDYICPPVCPIAGASSTGQAITGQVISPLTPMPPGGVFGGFLTFGPIIGSFCYGIYQQEGSSFTPLAQCVPPHSFVTCCAGCFKYSVITASGNGPLSDPVCTDGSTTITIPLPSGNGIIGYNIYQNVDPLNPSGTYVLALSGTFENVFLACAPGCYSFTAITTDGETPFSPSLCIPAGGCGGGTTLITDLVGYWPLDESVGVTNVYNPPAIDFSGNGNNLSEVGGPGQSNPGKIDRCYHPLASFLTHPDNAFLGVGPGKSFTINTWVNGEFDTNNIFMLGKWSTTPGLQDYLLFSAATGAFTSGQIFLWVYDLAGSLVQLSWPFSLRTNVFTWYMISFGYDDTLQEIWMQINNAPRISTPCVGVRRTAAPFSFVDTLSVPTNPPTPGASQNPLSAIDETGMWSRPLTLAEITLLWNGGAGNTYPFA